MPNPNPLLSESEDDIVEPDGPKFKIFSGALKAFVREVDGVERKFLSCTASSTVKDLHGDVMTAECVTDMAPQAKNKGMTIFLNHSYKVPEDVFGRTVDAKIISRSVNEDGSPIYDLDLEVMLNEANERAVDTYTSIKEQGIKLGVSIGAMIDQWEFIDEEEGFWGGLEIQKVQLLEASIVGIPANQRSWVINGIEALGAPKQIIRKAAGLSTKKEAPVPAAPAGTEGPEVASKSEETENKIDTEVELSTAPETEETPGETEDTSSESDDTEGETKSETTLADATAAADKLASGEADDGLSDIILGFLEGAAEEAASLRKALIDVTKERDELQKQLSEATEVVETIAATPLGRKAQFSGPIESYRAKFGGIYDEGFLKLLDEGERKSE